MNRLHYSICLLSLVSLLSCDQSLPRTDISANSPGNLQSAGKESVIPALAVNNPAAPVNSAKLNPAHGQPGHRCEIAVGAPLNGAAAFQTTLPASAVSGQPLVNLPRNPALPAITTPVMQPVLNQPAATNPSPTVTIDPNNKALNPAHGLPGHRCDIAVGAQLNSPAAKPANVVATAPVTAASPAATAKGMNPKHGEPSHRCDIPVGAPLNSPVQKTNAAATANQPATVGPVAPTAVTTANPTFNPLANAAPADGLNPKHGDPGHRCDIAVGAPLNGKKANK